MTEKSKPADQVGVVLSSEGNSTLVSTVADLCNGVLLLMLSLPQRLGISDS
jgi:hypothetical protein